MTPKQLKMHEKAYIKNREIETEEYNIKLDNQHNLSLAQAWLTANWIRAKKMPDFDKVIKTTKKKIEEMADSDMLRQVQSLNKIFGGEVITDGGEK